MAEFCTLAGAMHGASRYYFIHYSQLSQAVRISVQYVKIKQAIAEQIESGQLSPRQKLPSERKLAESFDTTRVTLREALSLLEADGKIYREDRRGWFISPPPLRYNPSSAAEFHDLALTQNRQPDSTLLSAKAMLADKLSTRLLSLPAFSDIYRLDQILHLEKRPVAYVIRYIRPEICPDLLSCNLNQPLCEIYHQHYGLSYHTVRYRVTTSSLLGEIAQALHATIGTPALVIERTHYNREGIVIDACIELWRHDAICVESETILSGTDT